jgi:hypothetical protein
MFFNASPKGFFIRRHRRLVHLFRSLPARRFLPGDFQCARGRDKPVEDTFTNQAFAVPAVQTNAAQESV